MKPSRRSDRRKTDDTKRDTQPSSQRPVATPVMQRLRADVPSEFIDLSTEPFRNAFPDLAKRLNESQRSRRVRRSRSQKGKASGSGGNSSS